MIANEARAGTQETLPVLLAERARRASDGALVAMACAGVGGAALIVALAHSRWRLTLPFIALAAFGLWGIADRSLAGRSERAVRRLRIASRALAFLGFGSALAFAVVIASFLLGGHW